MQSASLESQYGTYFSNAIYHRRHFVVSVSLSDKNLTFDSVNKSLSHDNFIADDSQFSEEQNWVETNFDKLRTHIRRLFELCGAHVNAS